MSLLIKFNQTHVYTTVPLRFFPVTVNFDRVGCIRSATVREGDWDDPVRLAVIVTGSIIADRGNMGSLNADFRGYLLQSGQKHQTCYIAF